MEVEESVLDNLDFINEFVEEAVVHIETVEESLLEMERGKVNSEMINRIFRAVHSIKGTAGFFGLDKIVALSHLMETLFGALRSGDLIYRDVMGDVLMEANDCLKQMIGDVANSNSYDIDRHLLKLQLLSEPDPDADTGAALLSTAGSLSLADENGCELKLGGSERIIISDSLKHGHHIYRVSFNLCAGSGDISSNPLLFMKKITSIGSVIQSYTSSGEVADLDSDLDINSEFIFLFSTVLEKRLMVMALDIDENLVSEMRPVWEQKTETPVAALYESSLPERIPEPRPVVYERAPEPPPRLKERERPVADRSARPVDEEIMSEQAITSGLNDESIRVHIKTLNDLLSLAGEMVLARNQLVRMSAPYTGRVEGLDRVLHNIDHLTSELQAKIMQTRLQPISTVFSKFPRMLRDLSRKTGKEIELVIKGGDVEMDKSIIEGLGDPLTHIFRNAVDHGIEFPLQREGSGKRRSGRIELQSYHEGGQVHVLVSDDGAGIDRQRIKESAVRRGLVTNAEIEQMSELEILNLIFRPGFSTASSLSELSGRGVGMDVVKTNIEKMGGTVDIITELGGGTVFDLTLPLTVAIVPAIIVEAAGTRFTLPRANLQEMIRIQPDERTGRIELVCGAPVVRLRGSLMPLIHLRSVFKRPGQVSVESPIGEGSGEEAECPDVSDEKMAGLVNGWRASLTGGQDYIRILVLKSGARRFGLIVDKIHDGEEILVKPVPGCLAGCSYYSGVTILGDGRTAMILDVAGIAEQIQWPANEERFSSIIAPERADREAMHERQQVMIFKCSGPETFGVDMSMIARVQEIKNEDMEEIGERRFIKYRGEIIRVIRPEDYLPVARNESGSGRKYILIPKLVPRPVAILFEKIYDTVEAAIYFNDDTVKSPGILGTAVIQDRIVLLLNLYDVLEQAEFGSSTLGRDGESSLKLPMLEGCRVLLLEDTPFFARIEREYLEAAGCQVFLAVNGQEGLEIINNTAIDIIVSDINMPEMDGLQFIRHLRSEPSMAGIPAMALTSLSGDIYAHKGLEAGFDAYETKLDKNNLLIKINELLKERQAANAG